MSDRLRTKLREMEEADENRARELLGLPTTGSSEGCCLKPIPWPLLGFLGACNQHDHIGVYYMGPPYLGLYDVGEDFDLLGPFPALSTACRNCHCGWLEPADTCIHWWPDGFERDD